MIKDDQINTMKKKQVTPQRFFYYSLKILNNTNDIEYSGIQWTVWCLYGKSKYCENIVF
jgi:hypothetical protein